MKLIQLNATITSSNDRDAEVLRQRLREAGTLLINVMSSAGSGKTTLLSRLIRDLGDLKIGVMEADIDSDVDARRIEALGAAAIQVHTSGMCHMDAGMTRKGLEGMDLSDARIAFLENVGNLICPAEYDTGASKKLMILSVPEGDDKPLKYPLMFSICDVVLINKTDVLPYFDFDIDKCREYIRMRNPSAKVIPVCARTGEGIEDFALWLQEQVKDWKQQ